MEVSKSDWKLFRERIGNFSMHVETIVLLSQRKADDYVEVDVKSEERY